MAYTRGVFRKRIKKLVISASKAVKDALDLIKRVQSKRAEKSSGLATDRAGKGGGTLEPVEQGLSQALEALERLDDVIEGVAPAQRAGHDGAAPENLSVDPGVDAPAKTREASNAKSQGGVDD